MRATKTTEYPKAQTWANSKPCRSIASGSMRTSAPHLSRSSKAPLFQGIGQLNLPGSFCEGGNDARTGRFFALAQEVDMGGGGSSDSRRSLVGLSPREALD